jgi:CCR4-NOT transcription complex subunit 9
MASLLQEIISVYPLLNPSQLTAAASNRVCNALALLQCVASHTETRGLFLSGKSYARDEFADLTQYSAHPALPIPVFEHDVQVATLRIPSSYVSRRHRRPRQE